MRISLMLFATIRYERTFSQFVWLKFQCLEVTPADAKRLLEAEEALEAKGDFASKSSKNPFVGALLQMSKTKICLTSFVCESRQG